MATNDSPTTTELLAKAQASIDFSRNMDLIVFFLIAALMGLKTYRRWKGISGAR